MPKPLPLSVLPISIAKQKITPKPWLIIIVLKKCMTPSTRLKCQSFNCKMETDFDPGLPLVSVIPQDIGRVLLNLPTIKKHFQV